MRNNKKKGFTLIELIAVIAILAILGFILVPNILGYRKKAEMSNIQSSAKTLLNAFNAYNADKDSTIGNDSTKFSSDVQTLVSENLIDSTNLPICLSNGSDVKDIASLSKVANGSFSISGSVNGQSTRISVP